MAFLDFGNKLHRILEERTFLSPSVRQELQSLTKQLHAKPAALKANDCDELGTRLWNSSTGLLGEDNPQDVRFGVLVRVFALLLLHTANRTSSRWSKDPSQRTRILKVAVRASRLCLEKNELDFAVIALEKSSHFVPSVPDAEPLIQISTAPEDALSNHDLIMKTLTSEYYLLRLLHAWKSDRLDLASHFYPNIGLPQFPEASTLHTKAADVFYEVGRSLSKTGNRDEATVWYERAFTALVAHGEQGLGREAAELLLSIGIHFIEDLLSFDRSTCRRRASEVAAQLEGIPELGNRIAIPIARFKVIANEQQVDPEQVTEALLRIVKSAVLTNDSFKVIVQTIHKAYQTSPHSAMEALKAFISLRILPEIQAAHVGESSATFQAWLEMATVTCTLFATNNPSAESLAGLSDLLDKIKANCTHAFSPKATHSLQALIWKASGGDSDRHVALASNLLLRHPIFDNVGYLNKARIGRKLMRNALEVQDLPAAREAFFQMSNALQNEPLTRYLAFKLALQTSDEDLAMSSLNMVAKAAAKDPTILYACVLESQQSQMRHMAVAALQAVLDQRPYGIHMPSLLRCTARLLIAEMETQTHVTDRVALEIVKVFEGAGKSMGEIRQSNQWRTEVQWWSKNAYNLAIRLCAEVKPEHLVRLLDVCIHFMDNYPSDASLAQQDKVEHRRMLCTFLAATAFIVMGRSNEPGSEYALQCYLHAQQHIASFRSILEAQPNLDPDKQTAGRSLAMHKFNLECILRLKQWDSLSAALQACLDAPTATGGRWDTLADLLIIIYEDLDASRQEPHAEMLIQLLQRIINETWRRDKNISKVSRWLRYTFTMCLAHPQGDFSLQLLQQAAKMAENGSTVKHPPYPEQELQFLATTSFNHAVDLLIEERLALAAQWMDGALELARWAQDNGSLHGVLYRKREEAQKRMEDGGHG